jgi:hypothetical protein
MPRWPEPRGITGATYGVLLFVVAAGACGGGGADSGGGPEKAGGPGQDSAPEGHALEGLVDCLAEPEVSWSGWASGFFLTHCQGCHAATTPDRRGAPEGVDFDAEPLALQWREPIYDRVVVDQDMPPAGGLTADDLHLITVYLACAPGG